ncbi:MAG: hypothetical protein Q7T62_00605 [Undibacterium sp.]|nr:hypothetical protein [Undibacterium sp.]
MLEYKNYYKWVNCGSSSWRKDPELVGEVVLQNEFSDEDLRDLTRKLDDFLLLVSWAEGASCALLQIVVQADNYTEEIYRLDRGIPEVSKQHSFHNFLVDYQDISEFLSHAWKLWDKWEHKGLVRTALLANGNSGDFTMEAEFLRLFSSVETLLLVYRMENSKEFIIQDRSNLNVLKREIKKVIKSQAQLSAEDIGLLCENIGGINRVSLKHAFQIMVRDKGLQTSDLWPFYDTAGVYSLTKIRNSLVHGYGMRDELYDSFAVAIDNIRHYYNRVVIALFRWEFKRTRIPYPVSPSEIKKWQQAAAKFTSIESK